MIDIALLAIVGLVAWCVAAEGAWGALLTFLSTFFAGIIAMNYFEPVASLLANNVGLGPSWSNRWDFIALMGLFIALTFAIRLATEQLLPTFIEVHPLAHDGVRWLVGVMTGYLTMAIVLTSLHTTALPRTFIGFEPERNNFLGMAAPDRQWLGFVQYMTEKNFTRNHIFDGSTVQLSNGQSVIIPSFAIRYATRRGIGGAASEVDPNAPKKVAPTPVAPGGGLPF